MFLMDPKYLRKTKTFTFQCFFAFIVQFQGNFVSSIQKVRRQKASYQGCSFGGKSESLFFARFAVIDYFRCVEYQENCKSTKHLNFSKLLIEFRESNCCTVLGRFERLVQPDNSVKNQFTIFNAVTKSIKKQKT